jgi:hypothetical protein
MIHLIQAERIKEEKPDNKGKLANNITIVEIQISDHKIEGRIE